MDDTCGPRPLPANLGLDELEDRLCRLAARLAAAECEFLELFAEFDRRDGWGAVGIRSAAQWLSWRCGMTPHTARERVRVARALTLLPLVSEQFRAGRLSYSKVRALTRVATASTEADLVTLALGATGAQLERITRTWRTTLTTEESASQHLRRGLTRREEADGSVVYRLRVAPEEAAVVDAAVAAARTVVLDDDGRPVETPEETALAAQLTEAPPAVRASADAFVLMAESFVTSPGGAEAGESRRVIIHAELRDLQSVGSTPAPASDLLPLDVADQAAGGSDGDGPVELRARALRPATCTTDSGRPLAPMTVLRHLCESSARVMLRAEDGHPLDLGRTVRDASTKQREALHVRDGCCRFAGCTQRHRLIPHHVRWWSRDGHTDLDNLVLLCPTHHRAVHEVGYTVTAHGRGRFTFRRPDGRLLPGNPPPVADDGESLSDAPVDATTIRPTWGGEPLDLELLVWAMSANALVSAGHDLPTLPTRDLPAALRAAVGWPPTRESVPREPLGLAS